VELRPSPRRASLAIRGITPRFHPRREKPAFAMKADIDREHSPNPLDSQNHRSRREPLSIDDSDEGMLAASIIGRRRYDAMLPSRNFCEPLSAAINPPSHGRHSILIHSPGYRRTASQMIALRNRDAASDDAGGTPKLDSTRPILGPHLAMSAQERDILLEIGRSERI
jgi:hypothetical protein